MSLGEPTDRPGRLLPGRSRRRSAARIRRIPDLRWLTALGIGLAAILILGVVALPLPDYWENFSLNTAADLIGAVFTIFVITPIIERAGQSRVREHPQLDYSRFLDKAARCSSVLWILDTYSNLLIEPLASRFEAVVREAVSRGVSVRILLINPTTLAAEQRELELGQAEELRPRLNRNLETLRRIHDSFGRIGGPRGGRSGADFEVRLYASGPAVTMYRWDDRALVSFYPVGKLSGQSTQLEVSVDSPLGDFVNTRFQQVWRSAAPFQALVVVTVRDDVSERNYLVRYVDLDGARYLQSVRVEAFRLRARGPVTAEQDGTAHRLVQVDPEDRELITRLDTAFRDVYGAVSDTPYVRLSALTPGFR